MGTLPLLQALLLSPPTLHCLRAVQELRERVSRGVPPRPPDRRVRAVPAGVRQVQLGRQRPVRAVQARLEEGQGGALRARDQPQVRSGACQ